MSAAMFRDIHVTHSIPSFVSKPRAVIVRSGISFVVAVVPEFLLLNLLLDRGRLGNR